LKHTAAGFPPIINRSADQLPPDSSPGAAFSAPFLMFTQRTGGFVFSVLSVFLFLINLFASIFLRQLCQGYRKGD
jgi:hypothetical protein